MRNIWNQEFSLASLSDSNMQHTALDGTMTTKLLRMPSLPTQASGLEEQVILSGRAVMGKRVILSSVKRQSRGHLSDLFFYDLRDIQRIFYSRSSPCWFLWYLKYQQNLMPVGKGDGFLFEGNANDFQRSRYQLCGISL